MSATAQNVKVVSITAPGAAVNGASASTAELDSRGWEYLQVVVLWGTTDVAATVLKLTESSTSGSGHVDIVGTRYGTDAAIDGTVSVLPTATDDGKIYVIDVDLRGRKQFIDLALTVASGAAGAFVAAFAILSRGHATPTTATERGAAQVLRV